jgi:hypothetical protein
MSRTKRVEVVRPVGNAVAYRGTVKIKATGAPFDFTGYTGAARLIDGGGNTVGQWTVTLNNDGTFLLALTSAQTTALGPGTWRWALGITAAGETTTWIFGILKLEDNTV